MIIIITIIIIIVIIIAISSSSIGIYGCLVHTVNVLKTERLMNAKEWVFMKE